MRKRSLPPRREPVRVEGTLHLEPTVERWEVELLARLLGEVLRDTPR